MSQFDQEKIWQKHTKEDASSVAAVEALEELNKFQVDSLQSDSDREKHAQLSRLALVLSKSAALKTDSLVASEHLQNAIKVLLQHYPVAEDKTSALERSKIWENTIFENQSAQLICLRDMLSLLEFVAKVAPSEEISGLNKQVLALLLEISEEKSSEVFALIALIEKADYLRAAEAFKTYSKDHCFSEKNPGLDQIITVSTRFLERAIQAKDYSNGALALENIFKVFSKDQGFTKRIILDMTKALFPSMKETVIEKAAEGIRNEATGKEDLQELVSGLLKLAFIGIGKDEVKIIDHSI